MHWRAHADHMTDFATYDDPGGVVAAVRDELAERVEAALAAGVAPERLVLDPGLGFAKRGEHNWQLLADLGPIKALGYPLLVGASRKSFLGTLLADADGNPRPVDDREDATTALSVVLAGEGVWGLRVHDVRSTRDALRVLHALDTAREEGEHMTDELALTGLECWGHHGVFEHERREGQRFVIDLVLGIDTAAAAASDDLSETVDYGSLALSVKAAVEKDPVDLIETLAHRIAEVCLLDSRVEWVRVTVHKPDAPIDATFSDVALTITRRTPGGPPVTETPNPNIIDADTLTGEMRPIRRAVLSLGSNLGERMDNLQGAVRALADTPDVWVTGSRRSTRPSRSTRPTAPTSSSTRSCWPTPRWPPPGCWIARWPSRTPSTASAARSRTRRARWTST